MGDSFDAEQTAMRSKHAQAAHKARQYDELMAARGRRVSALFTGAAAYPATDVLFDEVRIRFMPGNRGDYLIIVKASVCGEASIAFASGGTPLDALLALCGMVEAGKVVWRAQKPFPSSFLGPAGS